jgi:hypothetical protein
MSIRYLLAVLSLTLASACGDGDDTGECQLDLNDTVAGAGTLTYDVTSSGAATIHRIVYEGASGPMTLESPSIPFKAPLQIAAGASIHLRVVGTTESGGKISAGYTYVDASGQPVQEERSCP